MSTSTRNWMIIEYNFIDTADVYAKGRSEELIDPRSISGQSCFGHSNDAAIGAEHLTVNPGGIRTSEKRNGVGDVLRLA